MTTCRELWLASYKITISLMAVSHAGRAVGLMWDPSQEWFVALAAGMYPDAFSPVKGDKEYTW